jgi:hypothetical protein
MKMNRKILIFLLSLLSLMVVPSIVQAATITVATFDKDVYLQGETGYLTVTVYNDEEEKIRVYEITVTIEYYYTDGNVYLQSFFTNATLPAEIQRGDSSTFYVPFSLPTNIAPGYTDVYVKAKTELWRGEAEVWSWSDHPTYQPTIYIESPYKQQLEEQQANNRNTTTMMYLFGATTIVFVAVTIILFVLNRGARAYAKSFTQHIA